MCTQRLHRHTCRDCVVSVRNLELGNGGGGSILAFSFSTLLSDTSSPWNQSFTLTLPKAVAEAATAQHTPGPAGRSPGFSQTPHYSGPAVCHLLCLPLSPLCYTFPPTEDSSLCEPGLLAALSLPTMLWDDFLRSSESHLVTSLSYHLMSFPITPCTSDPSFQMGSEWSVRTICVSVGRGWWVGEHLESVSLP